MLLCVKYETLTSQLEDAAAAVAACHRKQQQPKKKNFTTKNFIHKNLSNSFFTIFIRTPISEYLLARALLFLVGGHFLPGGGRCSPSYSSS